MNPRPRAYSSRNYYIHRFFRFIKSIFAEFNDSFRLLSPRIIWICNSYQHKTTFLFYSFHFSTIIIYFRKSNEYSNYSWNSTTISCHFNLRQWKQEVIKIGRHLGLFRVKAHFCHGRWKREECVTGITRQSMRRKVKVHQLFVDRYLYNLFQNYLLIPRLLCSFLDATLRYLLSSSSLSHRYLCHFSKHWSGRKSQSNSRTML